MDTSNNDSDKKAMPTPKMKASTDSSSSGDSSSSPPPPSNSNSSPPPPSSGGDKSSSSSPPSDNKSSPPPPSNNDNKNSSPPSNNSDKSPPPPENKQSPPPPSPSPPPPSNKQSPPPPSPSPPPPSPSPPPPSPSPPPPSNNNDNNKQSPPPPSNDSNNNNNNDQKSSPPPPSPSPPPPSDSSNNGGSPPPPPPLQSPPPPSSPFSPPQGALAPPHPKAKSPPHHAPPKSSGGGHKEDGSINEKAIIGGVVAGLGLLFIVIIALLVCCCRRKKRKHYYSDHSNHHRSNDYYNGGGGWRNNNGPSHDHVVKVSHSAAVSSEHGWASGPPPPPPPMLSSSELSSAAFSGPYNAPPPPPPPAMALGLNQSSFTYDDLAAATGGFAQSNLLGQGGFGYVHKGMLPNGLVVAVKSLKANSGQGEREFQAEVDIISRVHHRHLVSLVGYCIAGSQRMLVYEFVPNGTLEHHLFSTNVPPLDWSTRVKIAMGSAKGFAYLHEDCHPRIIHRDIKAANILLDENMEAKVADFGLAKLSSDTQSHVSTRIMGTFGYLAPEYASSGKLTEKSDVYSYGVLLLEIITGRRPIDMSREEDDSLIDWARPILTQALDGGSYEDLVDPRLESYEPQEMLRMVACAAACIRHSARRRPKMSQVVRALEGDVSLDDLNEGVRPGHSGIFGSSGSSEYDGSYHGDMKKFRKAGLSSADFTSSEHGTGEFVPSGGESAEIHPKGMRGIRNTP